MEASTPASVLSLQHMLDLFLDADVVQQQPQGSVDVLRLIIIIIWRGIPTRADYTHTHSAVSVEAVLALVP